MTTFLDVLEAHEQSIEYQAAFFQMARDTHLGKRVRLITWVTLCPGHAHVECWRQDGGTEEHPEEWG